jgi:cysteine desulfurase/selenocysteine lyase
MGQLIYLDNAATTFPKPEGVCEYMMSFYSRCGVNPGRSGYDLSMEAEELVYGTRKTLAAFFGGQTPERLIYAYNATDALNLLINGIVGRGDHVVSTKLEHNSVLRPLYHKQIEEGAEVDYVAFDSHGYLHPEDIDKAIRPNTKLVIVNHASNVLGTVQSLAEIGVVCKKHGVPFAIDASQSAGVVPIDMQSMCIGAVAFTGHKSLMGPTGIGGLCMADDLEIRITRFGGTGVRSAVRTHLYEYPYRLEAGTLNLIGVAGLRAGLNYVLERGRENIHHDEMKLYRRLVDGLRGIDGVVLHCTEGGDHLAVCSFNVEGMEAADVGTMLDVDYDIACRTGLHCAPLVHESIGTLEKKGSVRLSIGAFNTKEDIEAAIEAVRDIADLARQRMRKQPS